MTDEQPPKKRGPKRKGIKRGVGKNVYWDQTTEDAIVAYASFDISDPQQKRQRDRLFAQVIYPALKKLAQNVFWTQRFKILGYDPNDIIDDGVAFMTEQLHKYDPSRGSKAFSFFTVWMVNYFRHRYLGRPVERMERDAFRLDKPHGEGNSFADEYEKMPDTAPGPDADLFAEAGNDDLQSCPRGHIALRRPRTRQGRSARRGCRRDRSCAAGRHPRRSDGGGSRTTAAADMTTG